MNIIYIIPDIGHYHHSRINSLASLKNMEIQVFELFSRSGFKEFRRSNLDTRQYKSQSLMIDHFLHPLSVEKRKSILWSTLFSSSPEIICIPGWSNWYALAALSWCNQHGVPAIVMSDSTAHDEIRRVWKEAIKRRVIRLFSAGLVGGNPHINYLASLGMPHERIFTGYDVVDNHHFAIGSDEARQNADTVRARLALPRNFFLASNRFIEKKNLPRLIEAYAQYQKQAGAVAWKLVLLGDGPFKPIIQDLVKQHDLSEWVLMPGFKQYDDLPIYYGLAGAFVHASTTEQWGLVVNEAMASGLPVLVSNRCGCAPDLVDEGRNGYTFDPYDVDALAQLMLKIASDACDRAAMGQASREIIARWTPQTFAENLYKAAEAALNAPRPKATFLDKALLWVLMRR